MIYIYISRLDYQCLPVPCVNPLLCSFRYLEGEELALWTPRNLISETNLPHTEISVPCLYGATVTDKPEPALSQYRNPQADGFHAVWRLYGNRGSSLREAPLLTFGIGSWIYVRTYLVVFVRMIEFQLRSSWIGWVRSPHRPSCPETFGAVVVPAFAKILESEIVQFHPSIVYQPLSVRSCENVRWIWIPRMWREVEGDGE